MFTLKHFHLVMRGQAVWKFTHCRYKLQVLGISVLTIFLQLVKRRQLYLQRLVVHGRNGDSTIEIEPLATDGRQGAGSASAGGVTNGGRAAAAVNGQQISAASTARFETVDETSSLLYSGLDWGSGVVT